jgi:hypothetical protein
LEMSTFNAGFASWNTRFNFFIIVLNIFLPKVGIGGGSKIKIYFLF